MSRAAMLPPWQPSPVIEGLVAERLREISGPNALVPISNAQNERMLSQRGMSIKASRFDLQFTTDENRQLWAFSDMMSVDAQANAMVRRTLRMRCRYAYHNNPFAMGCANRLANYVVGPGPMLHLATGDKAADTKVEKSFTKWAKRVALGRKLRVSRAARFYNGEGFNILRTNPAIRHPVKLDLFEIEADQVTSPLFGIFPSQYPDQLFDGLVLDPWGNREVYHILRQHPGAFGAFLVMGYEFDAVPAAYVVHDYARLRPAQQRGIPEMTPAAQHWEELRRMNKAVLAAAEEAAAHSGWLQTEAPGVDADGNQVVTAQTSTADIDFIQGRRRQWGVLPWGVKAYQMKAEQPTTLLPDYVKSQLMEISQVMDMPLFIVTGDARDANMSSAYVATGSFEKRVATDREEYEIPLDDQILPQFLEEGKAVGEVPRDYPDDPDHSWRWKRTSNHADPQKMSQAMRLKMQNGMSPSTVFSEEGLDWDEQAERGANDYGVTPQEFKGAVFQSLMAQRGNVPPAAGAPGTGDVPEKPETDEED